MTMQSYLDSGTTGDPIQHLRLHPLAQLVGNGSRLARLVVVADERSPAVGHEPVVALGAHLEAELERRSIQLRRPDVGADQVAEERRRAVGDVALGEDEAELPAPRRSVVGRELQHVVDAGGLEEPEELDVVHVLHGIEVTEADALDGGEALCGHLRGSGRFGIWIRAIALTSFQKSQPEAPITATDMRTAWRFSAVASRSAKMMITRPSSASMPSTAQYLARHIP